MILGSDHWSLIQWFLWPLKKKHQLFVFNAAISCIRSKFCDLWMVKIPLTSDSLVIHYCWQCGPIFSVSLTTLYFPTKMVSAPAVYNMSNISGQSWRCKLDRTGEQNAKKIPRFKKAFEGSDHCVHWPLISRLKLREQGGPTTVWLGQVGAVVPGMMRVVVNQPHLLEEEYKV